MGEPQLPATPVSPASMPANVVVVLLDSLNRHALGAYGGSVGGEGGLSGIATPNLDRFAATAVRFDEHYAGSLPCMPARHDLLVGALDFLWRPWGSIEVWEDSITMALRHAGVTTMLVSDHPHLFERGGENYHTDFHAWDYVRGMENDPWRLVPDRSGLGAPDVPEAAAAPFPRPYDVARTYFRAADDFPVTRTMAAAAAWVDDNATAHDRWMLFVDEFAPHEPFDTPEPYASRYDPSWSGPKLIWPPYRVGARTTGALADADAHQLQATYAAAVSFADEQFGRLLDAIDRSGRAADTAVFVLTDHGLYLGEPDDAGRDLWGKPGAPLYQTLVRTPLLVRWPGRPDGGVVEALTTAVDVHTTLCEVFGVTVEHRTHGRSLVPLLRGEPGASGRDWVLAGVFGRWVHVITPELKYARSHVGSDNVPLSMWSNRWSTMPLPFDHGIRLPRPDGRAWLDRMPGSDVPVIRQPVEPGDLFPYWCFGAPGDDHHLFDLRDDPLERRNLAGVDHRREREVQELLRVALQAVEAPDEHLVRLGLR